MGGEGGRNSLKPNRGYKINFMGPLVNERTGEGVKRRTLPGNREQSRH